MEFKFGDRVVVRCGFYEGCAGKLIGHFVKTETKDLPPPARPASAYSFENEGKRGFSSLVESMKVNIDHYKVHLDVTDDTVWLRGEILQGFGE